MCRDVIRPYGPSGGGWEANVLTTGSDGAGGTWIFCEGEGGSGIGSISARSTDGNRWTTQSLPGIGQRNHAGDEVSVTIGSQGHASLTRDSFVSGIHNHVWTTNGGTSWFGLTYE